MDKVYLKSSFGYREDTKENWEAQNPVLERGEPAIVRDGIAGRWLKIGDGVTPFGALPWKTGPKGEQGIKGEKGDKGDAYILTDADKTEIADMAKPVIDQSYSPESENPQSGVAIEERLKSKVLLDITLTEEQAGASSVMVAIPNCELLRKAKQWNLQIKFPYFKEYEANTLWLEVRVQDEKAVKYHGTLGNGYNVKFPMTYSENYGYWNLTIFNTKYEDGSGMLTSYYLRQHPWAIASANSAEYIRGCNWNYTYYAMTNDYPPFLKLSNGSGFIFEAGTRIFLEVVL